MSTEEFAAFYAGHKDRCLRAAMGSGMSRDHAEEAVAEAFARAWSHWRKVRNHEFPAAWVVRTAINADISRWRRRRREVFSDRPPDATVADAYGHPDLVDAVRRLPNRQREVVALRYLLDLDTESTARALNIAPGTVKAHLHHALTALRAHLTHVEGMIS